MKIGIICPSEIALRRFMPALKKIDDLEFVGLGVCSAVERFGDCFPEDRIVREVLDIERQKAEIFIAQYGGKIFGSYQEIVESKEIEAIYIPLPPALHYKWAKRALENNKHVLVEKPSTISATNTRELVKIARERGLALHENYMFNFHVQLDEIEDLITAGQIGDVRLYRICFGFPRRAANDFRYNAALGGGALIDAGGYTIKYATRLLGKSAKVRFAQMNYIDEFDVDIYGSGVLTNNDGTTVQIAFGMDNNYKCELEAWGSKGCLTTSRVLTAPDGFVPEVNIRKGNDDDKRKLSADDAFKKSIERFIECVHQTSTRLENYSELVTQAELVDEFRRLANERGC